MNASWIILRAMGYSFREIIVNKIILAVIIIFILGITGNLQYEELGTEQEDQIESTEWQEKRYQKEFEINEMSPE